MLDVSWVDEQIERLKHATPTMQTARDFALLCIAREHLQPQGEYVAHKPKGLLQEAPTLDDVEEALTKINVSTAEERRRAQGLREVTRIAQGATE